MEIENQAGYTLLYPIIPEQLDHQKFLPGTLMTLATAHNGIPIIREMLYATEPSEVTMRVYISSHLPLCERLFDLLRADYKHLLNVEGTEQRFALHYGSNKIISVRLVAGDNGMASHYSISAVGHDIQKLIDSSRTCINIVFDHLMTMTPMPLQVSRIEVHSNKYNQLIAYQCVHPYNEACIQGELGGMMVNMTFAPHNTIYREAISSSSPYYRFLCAYRLMDGLIHTRSAFKKVWKQQNLSEPVPLYPAFDTRILTANNIQGLDKDVKSIHDFYQKLGYARNAVSHYLLDHKGLNDTLFFADGGHQREYSLFGSILLHGAREFKTRLVKYHAAYLYRFDRTYAKPMLMPTADNLESFKLGENEYYRS